MGWDGKKIIALTPRKIGESKDLYEYMLLPGETVLMEFKSIRDVLLLTDCRLITVDPQGITGRKKEYMSISFSAITAFSCESAGSFDLDAEFKVWLSGMGMVEFEFLKGTDIKGIVQLMSEKTVKR